MKRADRGAPRITVTPSRVDDTRQIELRFESTPALHHGGDLLRHTAELKAIRRDPVSSDEQPVRADYDALIHLLRHLLRWCEEERPPPTARRHKGSSTEA